MSTELYKDYFSNHSAPDAKPFFKAKGLPDDCQATSLLDNSWVLPFTHELVCGNIFVPNLPLNVTSFIQPMDIGVHHNVKQEYNK